MEERKDFPEWMVEEVYISQDGCCANCGCSLERGFQRHHIDGDPTNNSRDNLELLCDDCHFSTFKEDEWNAHKEVEREVLGILMETVRKAMEKEIPSTSIDRIVSACSKALSVSRTEKGLNRPRETLSHLHIQSTQSERWNWQQGYKEGFKKGFQQSTTLLESIGLMGSFIEGEEEELLE